MEVIIRNPLHTFHLASVLRCPAPGILPGFYPVFARWPPKTLWTLQNELIRLSQKPIPKFKSELWDGYEWKFSVSFCEWCRPQRTGPLLKNDRATSHTEWSNGHNVSVLFDLTRRNFHQEFLQPIVSKTVGNFSGWGYRGKSRGSPRGFCGKVEGRSKKAISPPHSSGIPSTFPQFFSPKLKTFRRRFATERVAGKFHDTWPLFRKWHVGHLSDKSIKPFLINEFLSDKCRADSNFGFGYFPSKKNWNDHNELVHFGTSSRNFALVFLQTHSTKTVVGIFDRGKGREPVGRWWVIPWG